MIVCSIIYYTILHRIKIVAIIIILICIRHILLTCIIIIIIVIGLLPEEQRIAGRASRAATPTPNPPTNIVDFRGFDSSVILI